MKHARVVVLALLVAGCGAHQTSRPAPSPPVADASQVDMCTVLTDVELGQLGIKLNTRKQDNELGVVGCGWVGKPFTLSLERDKSNLASYQARRHDPAFTSFVDKTVNGRAGVQLGVRRDHAQCAQFMDGGPVSLVVSVAASSSLGPPVDSCAQALRIAQMIEPRLPKAGG